MAKNIDEDFPDMCRSILIDLVCMECDGDIVCIYILYIGYRAEERCVSLCLREFVHEVFGILF